MRLHGYPVYRLKWLDSCAVQRWSGPGEVVNKALEIETVAAVVKMDKYAVTVTHSITQGGQVNDPFTIPRFAITEMRRVKR